MNKDFNYYITSFFRDYLPHTLGVSRNTILSYRDTFILFLDYLKKEKKIKINELQFNNINENVITDFLLFLENNRKNSISTRNQRLAAIHAFFKFVKKRELSYYNLCSSILSITFKKAPQNTISYFSKNELEILIKLPDISKKYGFRDYVLLLTMYETASRVSEIANLTKKQITITKEHSFITLHGKGNKKRQVTISINLASILKKYCDILLFSDDDYLFYSKFKKQITTKGINTILNKYVVKARRLYSDKFNQHYSSHSLRHSKAMHLLEDGVNLIYIRDFLGHNSIITTEIYARANPIVKEQEILKYSNEINAKTKYTSKKREDLILFLKNYEKKN